MCAFHSRAFLVARSIYAARAAMAGRPMPPMPMPPGPICEDLQRFFGDGPAPSAPAAEPVAAPSPAPAGRLAGLFAALPARSDPEGAAPRVPDAPDR